MITIFIKNKLIILCGILNIFVYSCGKESPNTQKTIRYLQEPPQKKEEPIKDDNIWHKDDFNPGLRSYKKNFPPIMGVFEAFLEKNNTLICTKLLQEFLDSEKPKKGSRKDLKNQFNTWLEKKFQQNLS